MDQKVLFDSITDAQFEAMVLLAEASVGNYVISSDVSISGRLQYYELFDSEEADTALLVISYDAVPLNEESIEAANPGYCYYNCIEKSDDQKAVYLDWLQDQSIDTIPPLLHSLMEQLQQ